MATTSFIPAPSSSSLVFFNLKFWSQKVFKRHGPKSFSKWPLVIMGDCHMPKVYVTFPVRKLLRENVSRMRKSDKNIWPK